jgi:hypothetical protein
MDVDDLVNRETAIVAGLTAAACSPRARNLVRRGAVMGIAGVMTAGDAIASAARGAAQQAKAVRPGGSDGAASAAERKDGQSRRSGRKQPATTGT